MKTYLWLLSLLVVAACQKEAVPGTEHNAPLTMKDVAYGADARQKMDIYLPASGNTDTTKTIVLMHGGGWQQGDKSDFAPYISQLQTKLPGYAIFNLNYRLSVNGTNLFPSQEMDIKAAIEFIYAKKSEYRISDKFVFLGASAGGHLALLQAYKYALPIKPRAVVSFFGPTDLAALYQSNLLTGLVLAQVVGSTPSANPSLYAQSSPVSFVSTLSAPTMLLHGGADPLVPASQSELLKSALSAAGVPNQYVFYPSESHGWEGQTMNDSFDKIVIFLQEYVN